MNKFLIKINNWNFTKCRAKYRGNKKANYTFYIVDYDFPVNYEDYKHVIEMRNKGVVKTKYFHTGKEAMIFIHNVTN